MGELTFHGPPGNQWLEDGHVLFGGKRRPTFRGELLVLGRLPV